VHGINDIRQTEIHTAVPLVPESSASDVETGTEKLTRHISPGIHQIPAALIKALGRTICSEIHKLINSTWNKKDLPKQWKESITVPVYIRVIKHSYQGILLLSTINKILSNILLSRLTPYTGEITGNHYSAF